MPRKKTTPTVNQALETLLKNLIQTIQTRNDWAELTTKELISMLVSLSRLRIALVRSNVGQDGGEEEDTEKGESLEDALTDLQKHVLQKRNL